jgi:hypothetical protein
VRIDGVVREFVEADGVSLDSVDIVVSMVDEKALP